MNIRYGSNLYHECRSARWSVTRDIIYIDDVPHIYTASKMDNFTELCPAYSGMRSKSLNVRINGYVMHLDLANLESSVNKLLKMAILT